MKKLKTNFSIDYFSNEKIPLNEFREKLKEKFGHKARTFYISEIADFYYRDKYKKTILDALSTQFDIPVCPITGEFVSYKLSGSIIFGKFSSNCTPSQITQYSLKNNENYKNKIEEFKVTRKGIGNPMFGQEAWNKGKSRENNESMKKISDSRIGIEFSEDTLNKMSKSAKKRKIHGHTGKKHSEASKQIMREKTIERFKNGKFPKTKSLPHRIVKEILENIFGECGKDFFEEKEYGIYSFDFCVGKNLIEVQGDYFHCNPQTRHAIPKNEMQTKNTQRDIRKKEYVVKEGQYNLIEFWENDIINNKEKIILCLKNLKK